MKAFFMLLMMTTLFGLYGCHKSDSMNGSDDEITIERQEDYNREDATDSKALPVERDDELKNDVDN
jgi:hypothetical protein